MKPLPLEEIRSAVVIRTDHIGDLVLSTPFLKALRRGLPQARITAVLPPYTREVLEGSPLVDEVRVYSHGQEASLRMLGDLRKGHPDLAAGLAPPPRRSPPARTSPARARACCRDPIASPIVPRFRRPVFSCLRCTRCSWRPGRNAARAAARTARPVPLPDRTSR